MVKRKDERQSSKRYLVEAKRHRKVLVRIAKDDCDFDWQWMHDFVCQKIKNMYEYYLAGDDVCQINESRQNIIKSLEGAINLIKELKCCYDEYFDKYGFDLLKDLGKEKDNAVETMQRCQAREDELYKKLYTHIGEHMREWWD